MDVTLPSRTNVDLYAVTGFDVNKRLKVTNLATNDVRLSTTEAGLINDHVPLKPYGVGFNETTDVTAWATCSSGGAINVQEVT